MAIILYYIKRGTYLYPVPQLSAFHLQEPCDHRFEDPDGDLSSIQSSIAIVQRYSRYTRTVNPSPLTWPMCIYYYYCPIATPKGNEWIVHLNGQGARNTYNSSAVNNVVCRRTWVVQRACRFCSGDCVVARKLILAHASIMN